MKLSFIIAIISMVYTDCKSTQQGMQIPTSITYESVSRGSSYSCTVNSQEISVVSQGLSPQEIREKISAKDWERLVRLANEFNHEDLERMESSTEKSSVDRAAIGKLKISAGKRTYESPHFDDSNPPKEIKPLIDKILALAETVE